MSNTFWFVYVLELVGGRRYVGFTSDLRRRMREHIDGIRSNYAYARRPFELIYYEACLSEVDARRRERYLKTTGGRRFLAKRLREYLFAHV